MLPPTGGRGVGMAPSVTGRGWGWVVFFAAEAVSRFPGPPLEDPPTSPPRNSTGGAWGELGGTTGARAAPSPRAAQRLQRSRPNAHEQRRLCGRRATKRSDWRGGRAAASTSLHPVFSGPAPGLAGDGGGVRDGRAPSAATCERGPIAKRASVMRSMTDEEARDPRARERAATCLSRLCRPDRVASGMEARQGARRRYPGGSTRSATARPRAAGRRPGPPGPGSNGTWAPTAASSGSRCSINSYLGNNGPCPPASNLGDDSPFNETFTPATLATCR